MHLKWRVALTGNTGTGKNGTQIKIMRVLHIFNEINFSGAEIMYAAAAPLFQEKGIKMTAVNTGEKRGDYIAEFEKANIQVIHRPISTRYKSPVFLLRYFREVYLYIKKEQVDVVHVHRSDIFWYYAVAAAMAGKKTIMTPHNVFKNRTITWPKAYLERWSARKFFKTTFQTISKSVYENELIYYKSPSVWINNWYNHTRFFPARDNEKNNLRQKLGLPENELVVISAGSCSDIKNHTAILDAMNIVLKTYSCTYLHLGTGRIEKQEKEKAAAMQLDQRVRFLGNRVNVRDYLIAADVYIMPSRYEGLPIAAVEAMACGLPCIFYNVPGLCDLIKNDDNGFLIDSNPELIAEKIFTYKNEPGLMAEKGDSAFRFVTTHFSMAKAVEQISALYKN